MRQSGTDQPQVLGRASCSFHEKETAFGQAANQVAADVRAIQKHLNLAGHFEAKRFTPRGALAHDLERLFIGNAARIQQFPKGYHHEQRIGMRRKKL